MKFRSLIILLSLSYIYCTRRDKLNGLEKICVGVTNKENHSQTKASALVSLELTVPAGSFTVDKLKHAWIYAASKTYRLHCRVSDDGKYTDSYGSTVGDLPVDFTYYARPNLWNSEDKVKALEIEMNDFLTDLRWKVVVVGKVQSQQGMEDSKFTQLVTLDVILVLDHALADGFSVLPILQMVISKLEENLFFDEYQVPHSAPLTGEPPVEFEKMLKVPFYSWPLYALTTWEYCKIVMGPKKGRWEGEFSDDTEDPKNIVYPFRNVDKMTFMGLRLIDYGYDKIKQFKMVGKKYKSSLTSALTAAALLAHRKISILKGFNSNCQGLSVPINMRFFTTPPTSVNEVGNYFNGLTDYNFCYKNNERFWSVAQRIKKKLNGFYLLKHFVKQFKWLSSIARKKLKNAGTFLKRPLSIMISSINLDINGVGSLNTETTRVVDAFGTSSTHYNGARNLFAITVVTINQKTNILIGHSRRMVQDEVAANFEENFKKILEDVVRIDGIGVSPKVFDLLTI